MKEKRLKKGAKEAACSKKEFETIVVQQLSAEVSGKAQKYSRIGAREFVSFEEFGELTIQNIKDACMKHFGINDGKMTCDVLAGEQGPSCTSVKQLPSFKVIHVRFVDEEAVVEIPVSTDEQYLAEPPSKKTKPQRVGSPPMNHTSARIASAASPQYLAEPPSKKTKPQRVGSPPMNHTSARIASAASPNKFIPRSLSVVDMIKLGKVISKKTTSVQIYAFDMKDMSWSETPIVAEFTIEPQPFGVGGLGPTNYCPGLRGTARRLPGDCPES